MKKYFFIFLLISCFSCNKDGSTSPSNSDPNNFYPTVLAKLSQSDLDSLYSKLNQQLGTKYIAQIDSFGLLTYYNGEVPKPRGSTITDPAYAISLAKSAISDLNEFTNVTDTSALITRIAELNSATNDWQITFANQSCQGLEVWNTEIRTIVADQFILINQHHYRNITVPQLNSVSKQQAKSKLVGTVISFICWGAASYVISDSSINVDLIERCVYPLRRTNTIELHVVWRVPVSWYSGVGWYYFIDVVTGEIIASQKLFVC